MWCLVTDIGHATPVCYTNFLKSQSRVCQTWGLGTCLSMRSKPVIGPAAPIDFQGGRPAPKSKPLHSLSAIVSAALGVGCTRTRGWKVPGGGGGERGVCCSFRPFRPFSDHFKSKNLILDFFCCFSVFFVFWHLVFFSF